ncbi:MAG: DUF1844 domain-containing protein [Deltaproteobacteria bacterium]|jgi:hypothetical protein|nr:DUF1844 domain-containing protein [Deltaproteobacteria bacterium]
MPDKKEFIIKDRRAFAKGDEDAEIKEEKAEPASEDAKTEEPEKAAEPDKDTEDFQLPEINFATFIFSLNSSALMHLGVIEDPGTGKKVENLPIAKQTIDILGMLKEKTQGNLTEDEAEMLKNILYDLRMIYVKEKG